MVARQVARPVGRGVHNPVPRLPSTVRGAGESQQQAIAAQQAEYQGSNVSPTGSAFGTNFTKTVATPQGFLTINFTQVNGSILPTSISKNVVFTEPINVTSGNLTATGTQTYTYAVQNGKIASVQTGQNGVISYLGTPIANLGPNNAVSIIPGVTVASPQYGTVSGNTQFLGNILLSPTYTNGTFSFNYASFQASTVNVTGNYQATNPITGKASTVGYSFPAVTNYNNATGLINIIPVGLNGPGTSPLGPANLVLTPQKAVVPNQTGFGTLNISYNVSVTPFVNTTANILSVSQPSTTSTAVPSPLLGFPYAFGPTGSNNGFGSAKPVVFIETTSSAPTVSTSPSALFTLQPVGSRTIGVTPPLQPGYSLLGIVETSGTTVNLGVLNSLLPSKTSVYPTISSSSSLKSVTSSVGSVGISPYGVQIGLSGQSPSTGPNQIYNLVFNTKLAYNNLLSSVYTKTVNTPDLSTLVTSEVASTTASVTSTVSKVPVIGVVAFPVLSFFGGAATGFANTASIPGLLSLPYAITNPQETATSLEQQARTNIFALAGSFVGSYKAFNVGTDTLGITNNPNSPGGVRILRTNTPPSVNPETGEFQANPYGYSGIGLKIGSTEFTLLGVKSTPLGKNIVVGLPELPSEAYAVVNEADVAHNVRPIQTSLDVQIFGKALTREGTAGSATALRAQLFTNTVSATLDLKNVQPPTPQTYQFNIESLSPNEASALSKLFQTKYGNNVIANLKGNTVQVGGTTAVEVQFSPGGYRVAGDLDIPNVPANRLGQLTKDISDTINKVGESKSVIKANNVYKVNGANQVRVTDIHTAEDLLNENNEYARPFSGTKLGVGQRSPVTIGGTSFTRETDILIDKVESALRPRANPTTGETELSPLPHRVGKELPDAFALLEKNAEFASPITRARALPKINLAEQAAFKLGLVTREQIDIAKNTVGNTKFIAAKPPKVTTPLVSKLNLGSYSTPKVQNTGSLLSPTAKEFKVSSPSKASGPSKFFPVSEGSELSNPHSSVASALVSSSGKYVSPSKSSSNPSSRGSSPSSFSLVPSSGSSPSKPSPKSSFSSVVSPLSPFISSPSKSSPSPSGSYPSQPSPTFRIVVPASIFSVSIPKSKKPTHPKLLSKTVHTYNLKFKYVADLTHVTYRNYEPNKARKLKLGQIAYSRPL